MFHTGLKINACKLATCEPTELEVTMRSEHEPFPNANHIVSDKETV